MADASRAEDAGRGHSPERGRVPRGARGIRDPHLALPSPGHAGKNTIPSMLSTIWAGSILRGDHGEDEES